MCLFCAWNCASRNKARKTNKSTVKPAAFVLTGFLPPASSAVAFHTRVRRNSDMPAHLLRTTLFAWMCELAALGWRGVSFRQGSPSWKCDKVFCVIFSAKTKWPGTTSNWASRQICEGFFNAPVTQKRLSGLLAKWVDMVYSQDALARERRKEEADWQDSLAGFLCFESTHSCHLANYSFFLIYEDFAHNRAPSGNNGGMLWNSEELSGNRRLSSCCFSAFISLCVSRKPVHIFEHLLVIPATERWGVTWLNPGAGWLDVTQPECLAWRSRAVAWIRMAHCCRYDIHGNVRVASPYEKLRSVQINCYIILVLLGTALHTGSHKDFKIFDYNVCMCNCLCVVCCFFCSVMNWGGCDAYLVFTYGWIGTGWVKETDKRAELEDRVDLLSWSDSFYHTW